MLTFNISEQQSYNIELGTEVLADYCGEEVFGRVVDSRCKYGTRKQYTIELDRAVAFPWSGSDKQAGSVVLVDNTDILAISINV